MVDHVALRLLLALSLLCSLPALLPAAAADEIQTPSVAGQPSCNPALYVNSRVHVFCGTGQSTVCVEEVACQGSSPNGVCSQATRLIVCLPANTVPGVPSQSVSTCLVHNDEALTNACLNTTTEQQSIPNVSMGSTRVCPIGNVCADAPFPTTGTQTVTVPFLRGYVELTVACDAAAQACRVTIPEL